MSKTEVRSQKNSFLSWAKQICEVLIYLHTQAPPIVHRDLTPDNLVLSVNVGLVLIDFGAANAFIGTATGTMVGKQSYMPPEQLRGKSVPQSDIYALGCTLYFLLTGSDPMPLEVANPGERTKVSRDLNALIMECTAQKVEDRFDSAQAVMDSITAIRKQRSTTFNLRLATSLSQAEVTTLVTHLAMASTLQVLISMINRRHSNRLHQFESVTMIIKIQEAPGHFIYRLSWRVVISN